MTDRSDNSDREARSERQGRACILWALPALMIMGALCSCTLIPRRSEAMLRDTTAFASLSTISASPETQYVLMGWFCTTHGKDSGAGEALATARRRLAKAERDLAAAWTSELLRDFSPHLRPEGPNRFRIEPKAFTGMESPADIVALMDRLKARISEGILIDVDTDACFAEAIWADQPKPAQDAFRAWLTSFLKRVPFPKDMNFAGLLPQLDSIVLAAGLRAEADQMLRGSEAAEKLRRSSSALRKLQALQRVLEQSRELLAGINDTTTLARVDERIAYLSQLSVNEELNMIDAVTISPAEASTRTGMMSPDEIATQAERVGAAEKRFTSALKTWSEDELFAMSLEKYGSTIGDLLDRVGDLRIDLWNRQLEHLTRHQSAWNAAVFLREQLNELSDAGSVRFGCYHLDARRAGQVKKIQEAVSRTYYAPLAPIFRDLVKTAEKQAELTLGHGTSIAMCSTLLDMAGVGEETVKPEAILSQAKIAEERLAKSTAFFRRQMTRRGIAVREFESVIAGLGMIFQRDLAQLLRKALADEVGSELLEVREGGEQGKGDYAVTNGFIADFDATETTETQQFRTVKGWGEIQEKSNPEYARQLAQGQRQPAVPAKIYEQTQQEYAIRVHTVERLGHVRLSFDIARNGSKTPLELNHFFRKRFVREEIHPFSDVRPVKTIRAYSPDKLNAVEPEPVLQGDRVWTESEMLDWLRRITQEFIALSIAQHVQAYALDLAENAEELEAQGQLLKAVDTWGYCYQYCRLSASTDGDSAWLQNLQLLNLSDDETVKELVERAGKQWERRRELHSLVQNKMASAVMQFLQRRED